MLLALLLLPLGEVLDRSRAAADPPPGVSPGVPGMRRTSPATAPRGPPRAPAATVAVEMAASTKSMTDSSTGVCVPLSCREKVGGWLGGIHDPGKNRRGLSTITL